MGNAVRSIFYRKFSSQDYFLEDEGESIELLFRLKYNDYMLHTG